MKENKNFQGVGKPLTLIAKIIAVIFIIFFSIFYYIYKGKELSVSSALGLLIITVGIDIIFLSVNLSILLKNITKLRQAILGTEIKKKK